MVFWGKTYDVSPYDSQRLHPSMNLDVQWDLCVQFVQTTDRKMLRQLIGQAQC